MKLALLKCEIKKKKFFEIKKKKEKPLFLVSLAKDREKKNFITPVTRRLKSRVTAVFRSVCGIEGVN